MKKTLRIVSIVFLSLLTILLVVYLVLNEKLPEGQPGEEADQLAEQMVMALNKPAWDTTKTVSWTFKGIHDYEWNREVHTVKVKWDENEVILNPGDKSGIVSNAQNHALDQVNELINTAWDYFNNDSFWLCAPYKVFDPGTERSIVILKDGRKGLKVTYTSGGTTPGDTYVWILDDDYKPTAIKMWVSILPIGGMEFSWENYLTLPTGAMIAQDHFMYGSVNIDVSNVR